MPRVKVAIGCGPKEMFLQTLVESNLVPAVVRRERYGFYGKWGAANCRAVNGGRSKTRIFFKFSDERQKAAISDSQFTKFWWSRGGSNP